MTVRELRDHLNNAEMDEHLKKPIRVALPLKLDKEICDLDSEITILSDEVFLNLENDGII